MEGKDVLYFDSLVSPGDMTLGLSADNPHSIDNAGKVTSPKRNALQALEKARIVSRITEGRQVLLPPPDEMIAKIAAWQEGTGLRFTPSGSKYAANHATAIPREDADTFQTELLLARGRYGHRRDETFHYAKAYGQVLAGRTGVWVQPWPVWTNSLRGRFGEDIADEGRADYMRLQGAERGVWIFLHDSEVEGPTSKVKGRQSPEIGKHVAKRFKPSVRVGSFQKSEAAQDAGVFHQDVGAFASLNAVVFHEQTYKDSDALKAFLTQEGIPHLMIGETEVPLKETVENYLFNSQVVYDNDNRLHILAIDKILKDDRFVKSRAVLERIRGFWAAASVIPVNLEDSLRSGGGAACLRLDVPMDLSLIHI